MGQIERAALEQIITICKIDGQWGVLCNSGGSNLVPCDNPKGWDGAGGARRDQEGGNMYIPMSDPC